MIAESVMTHRHWSNATNNPLEGMVLVFGIFAALSVIASLFSRSRRSWAGKGSLYLSSEGLAGWSCSRWPAARLATRERNIDAACARLGTHSSRYSSSMYSANLDQFSRFALLLFLPRQ